MKLPNFALPLYGVGEHNTKIAFFSFPKLKYGPFRFKPQIKWNQIRSGAHHHDKIDEVSKSANSFLSDVFVCCHGSKIFSLEQNSVEENVCLKYDA